MNYEDSFKQHKDPVQAQGSCLWSNCFVASAVRWCSASVDTDDRLRSAGAWATVRDTAASIVRIQAKMVPFQFLDQCLPRRSLLRPPPDTRFDAHAAIKRFRSPRAGKTNHHAAVHGLHPERILRCHELESRELLQVTQHNRRRYATSRKGLTAAEMLTESVQH